MSCCDMLLTSEDMNEFSRLVAARLGAFLRTLRDNAFAVGLKEGQDAARLMQTDMVEKPDLLRSAFKHLFCARKADWDRFEGVFDAFWLGRHVRSRTTVSGGGSGLSREPRASEGVDARNGSTLADQVPAPDTAEDRRTGGQTRMEGASRVEALESIDFRKLADPADVERAHAIAARLAAAMRVRLTRRHQARRKGYRLDLRRTIHRNVSHGGVPIIPVRRRRKDKPLRLVMLLDASGSMSAYTAIFLRFMHGVLDEFREAEAFLFHTRLAHVSDAMKERDAARALDRLSMMAQGAGGGTRIGECLQTFNHAYARQAIHSRTCVMIVSDGYETGDAALLRQEMAALARRCRRIVWLNPMMGWDGYAPEAAGIKAALPYVDLHAPAHSLRSLAALEPYLARL
ncbi:VWA domain-containing protein [Rhizobium lusitanum]|uniref:VWA domain-containing protein n=1 Tax=Rhizobium lusitanum TaxID=293958 RepID=A0A6L9UBU0_9HYPH|nr:VWA domain-containing protein [Rhizobium lusitanum]NEI71600.1 VWA domain-containing protein [Rhizobium lusitanum]